MTSISNPINGFGINCLSIDESFGFPFNAYDQLWFNLLNGVQKSHPESSHASLAPSVAPRSGANVDDEVQQAINTMQIGMSIGFDGVHYAQAVDRSHHGFVLSVSNIKMAADYLVSDFKAVMGYDLKNFAIEILKEDAHEAVKN